MASDLLTSFKSPTVPVYADLFKVRHSDNQALLLFEDYLCYRALQDVLSLRASRWERLVKILYQYCKEIADDETKRWLCLVNLAEHIRNSISEPSQKNYCNVIKCYKANFKLFPSEEFHKKMLNELIVSVACYFLVIENDKNKVLEMGETTQKVQELTSAFPDFTDEQNEFMAGKSPHFVLVKILDQLRCVVMKMKPPVLAEIFDEYQCAAEEQNQSKKEASKSEVVEKTSGTAALSTQEPAGSGKEITLVTATNKTAPPTTDDARTSTIVSKITDEPDANMDISSPRRSSRTTPSKYKSMSTEISTPIKLIYLSTSCEVPENEASDSGVENVKKKTSTKPITIQEDSDSDSELKVDCDDDSEGQQPSSTVKNGDSPSTPKHRRGLRDLKVTGKVPNDWSSDESDELPNIPHFKEVSHRRRRSLEVPKRPKYISGMRHPWTQAEIRNLIEGVEKFGLGQWASILKNFYFRPHRDNVSLKDKWRNMVKNREVPKKYL